MRKYTKGQEVVVLRRKGFGEDMTLEAMRGTVTGGGTKNVTVEYVENGQTLQDSFDIDTGVRNGRHSHGKSVMTQAAYDRYQAAKDIEGSFGVTEESSLRQQTLMVTVQGRDSIWYETLGVEFEPRTVRLSFSQRNGGFIQLDEISLIGPKVGFDTVTVDGDRDVVITRRPGCYYSDLRSDDKIGDVYRNSLPEWVWAVAEKVWPNFNTL